MTNELQLAWHFPDLIVLTYMKATKILRKFSQTSFYWIAQNQMQNWLRFKQQFTIFSNNAGRN